MTRKSRQNLWARRRSRRSGNVRVLIVCEGKETEPNYFRDLWEELRKKSNAKDGFVITVKKGRGGSRLEIAQFAVDRKNEAPDDYDECHCIMDVEHHVHWPGLPGALRLLRNNGFTVHLSNPSFEVWLLAHFERTCASFVNADAVINKLDPLWRAKFGVPYEKNGASHFASLRQSLEFAIRNARLVRERDHKRAGSPARPTDKCNSSTDVYKFVERLASLKKPAKKRKTKKRHSRK